MEVARDFDGIYAGCCGVVTTTTWARGVELTWVDVGDRDGPLPFYPEELELLV